MKKRLFLIITLLLVITSSNIAIASSFPDIVGRECEEAVNYLTEKNVLAGYFDGTYRPDVEVKRSEFSKIVVDAYNLNYNLKTGVKFTDAENHWAEPYIDIVSQNGIVKGYSDATFLPDNQITYAEMFTMIIRAIGEEPNLDVNIPWPENYITLSKSLGIDNKLNIENYNNYATRGDVAIAVYNTLNIYHELGNNGTSITFSESSLTIDNKDIIIVTLENPPVWEYKLYFNVKDPSIVTCEWGDWISDTSIPLTINAKSNGTTTIEVYLEQDPSIKSIIEVTSNKPKLKEEPEEPKEITEIDQIEGYLTDEFGTLDTVIGTTNFTFNISENDRIYFPEDYWIQVGYEYEFFEGAMSSIKYTNEQKDILKKELKEHQKNIGEALIELLPNKKLTGGYYDSWYRYPNLKVDLITRSYYSWTNYDEVDWKSNISDYEQTEPSYFRWDDSIDDEL